MRKASFHVREDGAQPPVRGLEEEGGRDLVIDEIKKEKKFIRIQFVSSSTHMEACHCDLQRWR